MYNRLLLTMSHAEETREQASNGRKKRGVTFVAIFRALIVVTGFRAEMISRAPFAALVIRDTPFAGIMRFFFDESIDTFIDVGGASLL